MHKPGPAEMMDKIRALPAAAPLLAAIGQRPGIYLVGGAVRDLLLGRTPLDLDVVVEGDALALGRELGGEIRSYGRFGTVTVGLGGRTYDLASARRERYDQPGALPEVAPAGLQEDLQRRDFTVNALAVALTGDAQAGRIIDSPRALADLEARQMRILHPTSFLDDPTRLLRLIRYATRLEFAVEAETEHAARAAIGARALDTVSGPRIGTELRLAAREPDPVAGVSGLARWDLDHAIHPGFRLADPSLARTALALLPPGGRPDLLVLATSMRGLDPRAIEVLLDRLGCSAADRQSIVAAASGAPKLARALAAAQRPSEIAGVVAGAPAEAVALAGALGPAEAAAQWLDHLRLVELEITGADLLAAGIPSGPELGRGLAAARAAKLDGDARDRAGELQIALAAARHDG